MHTANFSVSRQALLARIHIVSLRDAEARAKSRVTSGQTIIKETPESSPAS